MLIKFVCGQCQSRLKIEFEYAGEKIACPKCSAGIRVPDPDIDSGVVIGGFEVKGLIGKGGMGEVYLARQLSMGRDIALKILPAHLTRNKALVDRFLKEVRNAAQLEHPNIVTAYAAGEDHGIYYMAMSYIRGENLDEILQRGPMDEHEALELIRLVAGALRAAWVEHGMIHRDIKPENIIVDQKGVPKILDMGLSKSIHDTAQSATSPDTIMGSPNYMSPEQIESTDSVDFRADMYSLGTTLYNMLTGEIPFYGGSYIETLTKQSTGQLDDPRIKNPALSDGCILFLERLLAKHPDDRYATYDELIDALDQVLAGKVAAAKALETGQSVLVREGHEVETANASHSDIDNLFAGKPESSATGTGKKKPKSGLLATLGILGVLAAVVIAGLQYSKKVGNQNNNPIQGLPDDPDITSSSSSPSDSGTAPPTNAPPEDTRLKELYSQAVLFTQANPEAYDDAIGKFAEIGMDAAGSDYAIRAAEQIERISAQKQAAIQATLQEIQRAAMNRMQVNEFDQARKHLEEYEGIFAFETEAKRQELIARIDTELERRKTDQEREAQRARIAMLNTANQIADCLLDGDTGKAVAVLEQSNADMTAASTPAAIESIYNLIQDVEALPETVMEQFTKSIGKEIDVQLKTGTQRLQIKKLNSDNSVTATRTIRNGDTVLGHSTTRFTYEQLTSREVMNRLEGDDDPKLAMLRGIVYMQNGSISNARKSFEACGTREGDLLKHRLDIRLGLAKEEDNSPFRDADLDGPTGHRPGGPGGLRGPRSRGPGNGPARLNASPRP